MVQVIGVQQKPRDEQIIVARSLGINLGELNDPDERQVAKRIEEKVYDGMVKEAMSYTGGGEASIREHFPTVEDLSSMLKERSVFNRDSNITRELFIARQWKQQRDSGLTYAFTPNTVYNLKGTIPQDGFSYGELTARRFREMLSTEPYVLALGAVSGHEAGNIIEAGSKGRGRLKAQYISGYYTSADKNTDGRPFIDSLLNASTSVPRITEEVREAFTQFDRNDHLEGIHTINWAVPIVADADTGYGDEEHVGVHTWRLGKAGASAIHVEDLRKKVCGHYATGQKVLETPSVFIDKLGAAQEQIAIMGTNIVLIARTDAEGAGFVTYDTDPRDKSFLVSEDVRPRHRKHYYPIQGGVDLAIERALAYAPYVDMIWFESTYPDLEQAKKFAKAIHAKYPGKLLAYNLSPSFNWDGYFTKKVLAEMNMTEKDYANANEVIRDLVKATVKYQVYNFTEELGKAGYKFQFGTYEALRRRNFDIARLAYDISNNGMAAWIDHEREENEAIKERGYRWRETNARSGGKYWDYFVKGITGDDSGSCLATACEAVQFPGTEKH